MITLLIPAKVCSFLDIPTIFLASRVVAHLQKKNWFRRAIWLNEKFFV